MTGTIEATTRDLRGAELQHLIEALQDRKTRAIDVVVPAQKLEVVGGAVGVKGVQPILQDDGVTDVDGFYLPTPVGLEGLAQKFPASGAKPGLEYLRRCQREAVSLFDANLNEWISRSDKSYLLRLLTHPTGPAPDATAGVMRALLSSRYRCIDDFDVLLAVLAGLDKAGVHEPIIEADLTDRRMVVRITTPEIKAVATSLLEGYRNPFGGGIERSYMARQLQERAAADPENVVYAGIKVSNSETGNGSFTIAPHIVVKVCANGQTIVADAMSNVHVGGNLADGVIQWSDETLASNLELVRNQTRDAVAAFLAAEYVEKQVEAIDEKAGVAVDKPDKLIPVVAKRVGFTEAEAEQILSMFVRGGQMTAGGVMNAVTATAQTVPADRAWELEGRALEALDVAASLAVASSR